MSSEDMAAADFQHSTKSERMPCLSTVLSILVPPLIVPTPTDVKALTATVHDRKIDNVIFDLGGVLFAWSANTGTSVSPKTMGEILRFTIWFKYEKGNISQEETFHLVSDEFSLDASEVAATILAARETIQINLSMFSLLHELKRNSGIRLYAMSNISAPDCEVLRNKACPEDWAVFDHVFTSAAVHERKPTLGYYRHVLESTGVDPTRTAFVDDKLENVIAAQSFSLKGIVFRSFDDDARELRTLLRNPIVDDVKYLRDHAKQMHSITNSGIVVEENFTQLIILEATGDTSIVNYTQCPRLCNFFRSAPVLTTASYPDDLDTTSLAYTTFDHFSPEEKNNIMDEMLRFKNKDGIIQVYFDVTRPCIDPVVCINVLAFFYANGRGGELKETFNWVYAILKNRAYTNGTPSYHSPDTFLFFLSRLLSKSTDARQRLGPLFAKRIAEQFGSPRDALTLAMRIHAAATVDLCDERDCERLMRMQEADGSWPTGWVYRYGVSGILIGNKGLTTALAVSAMKCYRELELRLWSFDQNLSFPVLLVLLIVCLLVLF